MSTRPPRAARRSGWPSPGPSARSRAPRAGPPCWPRTGPHPCARSPTSPRDARPSAPRRPGAPARRSRRRAGRGCTPRTAGRRSAPSRAPRHGPPRRDRCQVSSSGSSKVEVSSSRRAGKQRNSRNSATAVRAVVPPGEQHLDVPVRGEVRLDRVRQPAVARRAGTPRARGARRAGRRSGGWPCRRGRRAAARPRPSSGSRPPTGGVSGRPRADPHGSAGGTGPAPTAGRDPARRG